MKKIFLFAALVLLPVLLSCGEGFPPEFPAADFMLNGPQSGKTVSFAELKGRPVIIYWFTSW
ncbi:MAG: hypothetical protein EPN22_16620 [Nitrospirae bacterium]|nr:MAG: hypothetical protein EPN22_16620 [Nitrospirota bacterium]